MTVTEKTRDKQGEWRRGEVEKRTGTERED